MSNDRPEILALLLELGFDPNERTRFRDVGGDEVVFTWGMPLWHCAASGRHAMAEMLLAHGADPNASVYASGTPVSEAYGKADRKMITLLERCGGVTEPWIAAQYRQTRVEQPGHEAVLVSYWHAVYVALRRHLHERVG